MNKLQASLTRKKNMKFQTDNVDYRILVVGLQSAGKSSILHMIVNREDVLLHGEPVSTHGVEVVPFETASVSGKSVIFYEIGGNMSSRGLMNYYYDCEAVIYVVDSTKPAELTKEPYIERKEKEKEKENEPEQEKEAAAPNTLKIPNSISMDAMFTKADTFTDEDENHENAPALADENESSQSSSSDTSLEEVASPVSRSDDEEEEDEEQQHDAAEERTKAVPLYDDDDDDDDAKQEILTPLTSTPGGDVVEEEEEEEEAEPAESDSANVVNVTSESVDSANSTNVNTKLLPANQGDDDEMDDKQNKNTSTNMFKTSMTTWLSKFEKLRNPRNRVIPLIKSQTTDAVNMIALDDARGDTEGDIDIITEEEEQEQQEPNSSHNAHATQRKSVSKCKASKLLGMEANSQSSDNMLPSNQPIFGRSKSASAAVSRPSFSFTLPDRTRLSMVGKFKRPKKVKTNKATRTSIATTMGTHNAKANLMQAAAATAAEKRKLKPGSLFLQPLTMNEAKCHSAQELISKLNYEIKSVDVPFLIYYNKQDLVHRKLGSEEIEKRMEYETIINKTRRYSAFECDAADKERVYDGWNWLLQTLKEIKMKQKEHAKYEQLVNRLKSIDQDIYGPNAKKPQCVICEKPCKHTGTFCTVCGKWYCQADERKALLLRRSGNSKCKQCVGQKSIFFQQNKKKN